MIGFSTVLGVYVSSLPSLRLLTPPGDCFFLQEKPFSLLDPVELCSPISSLAPSYGKLVLPSELMQTADNHRSVMACMGEMTALFPVKGPVFEFPRRFIDESIGLATGWIIWYAHGIAQHWQHWPC